MASQSPRKRLREEVTCPVCLEYFTNPVTLTCEHSVCHACLLYSPTNALCPVCKRDFCTVDMKLNYALAGFVEINKLMNDQEEVGRLDTCGRHQKPLSLFCKDDEVLICTSCAEEHRDHNVVPTEEAAQEYEGRISASLETLKKRKEEIMATVSATQVESEDLLKQMEKERQKTAVKFRDLWPFLKSRGDRMLARVKRDEEQMTREKVLYLDRLDQSVYTRERLIREMEEKRELPASRFLAEVGSLRKRSEQNVELKDLEEFPLALKKKVSDFTDSRPGVEKAIKKLKDTVASCY